MRWLGLIFLIVPFVELWILLRIGDLAGFWATVLLVLGTAMVGAYLAKREGLRVFRDWQKALAEMRMPEEGITSGLLVLVGAVLLATPGVLSDAVGILLLVPPSRRVAARWIEGYVQKRMQNRSGGSVFDVRVVTPQGAYARRRVVDVEGEVIEDREMRVDRSPTDRAPVDRAIDRADERGRVIEGDVLEGEVVDSTTRRLGPGDGAT